MSGAASEGTLSSWVQGSERLPASSCWHPHPQAPVQPSVLSGRLLFLWSFICSQSTHLSSGAAEVSKSHQRRWASVFCFPWCFEMIFKNCSLFFIVKWSSVQVIFWKFLCMLFQQLFQWNHTGAPAWSGRHHWGEMCTASLTRPALAHHCLVIRKRTLTSMSKQYPLQNSVSMFVTLKVGELKILWFVIFSRNPLISSKIKLNT